MRAILCVPVAVACSSDDPPDCAAGFEPGPGANCYEIVEAEPDDTDVSLPPTEETILADLIASLPACVPLDPNGFLDLSNLCAGPFCVDMTYEELVAADDAEVPICAPDADDDIGCHWPLWDVTAWFWDEDLDGVILPEQNTSGIYVYPGFPGATAGGLGNGVSVACFIDVFGVPSHLEPIEYYGGDVWILAWSFDGFRFEVYDKLDESGYGGDGLVDEIWLNGPG